MRAVLFIHFFFLFFFFRFFFSFRFLFFLIFHIIEEPGAGMTIIFDVLAATMLEFSWRNEASGCSTQEIRACSLHWCEVLSSIIKCCEKLACIWYASASRPPSPHIRYKSKFRPNATILKISQQLGILVFENWQLISKIMNSMSVPFWISRLNVRGGSKLLK